MEGRETEPSAECPAPSGPRRSVSGRSVLTATASATAPHCRWPPPRRSGACGAASGSGGKPPLPAAPRRQGPRSAVPPLPPVGRPADSRLSHSVSQAVSRRPLDHRFHPASQEVMPLQTPVSTLDRERASRKASFGRNPDVIPLLPANLYTREHRTPRLSRTPLSTPLRRENGRLSPTSRLSR